MKTKSIIIFSFIFLGYLILGKLGLSLASLNATASPVWPASGFAVALLIIFGPRYFPAIFIGALLTNIETPVSWSALLLIGCGNTLEAVIAAQLISRSESVIQKFGPLMNLLTKMAAALIACTFAALAGAISVSISSDQGLSPSLNVFSTWLIGDAMGIMLITPLGLALNNYRPNAKTFIREILKFMALIVPGIGILYFIFFVPNGSPLLFLVFLLVLISACLSSTVYIYLTAVVIAAFAVLATAMGHGPFQISTLNQNLIFLEIILLTVASATIILDGLASDKILHPAWIALLIGWGLTGLTSNILFNNQRLHEEAQTETKAVELKLEIQKQLDSYIRALEAARGLFAASGEVDTREWKDFSKQLNLEENYPGVNGFGVALAIRDSEIDKYLRKQRIQNPNFKIFQAKGMPPIIDHYDDAKDLHLIITLIEPLERNLGALGLDLATEHTRLAPILVARDENSPQMTDPLVLVQNNSSGILIYIPFYKNGAPISTLEERRQAFLGVIYTPIVVQTLVDELVLKHVGNWGMRLFFHYGLVKEDKLFETKDWKPLDQSFVVNKKFKFAGHNFRLEVASKHEGDSPAIIRNSIATLAGTLFTLLVAILISNLQNTTQMAEKLAGQLSQVVLERERLWRTLTELAPIGIFLTDKEGHCTYSNREWAKMLGTTSKDFTGMNLLDFVHPKDYTGTAARWMELVRGGEFKTQFRMNTGTTGDQTELTVIAHAVSITGSDNKVSGFMTTILDITELIAQQKKLVTSSRLSSLGEMAAGVAHEINNPLAIISGKIQVLKLLESQGKLDSKLLSENFEKILDTTKRASSIIRGLKAFGRDDLSEPLKLINLDDILSDTLAFCQEKFTLNGVELKILKNSPAGLMIYCRPVQISQVLLNLLNNAFDAITKQKDKSVTIKIEVISKNLMVSVTDSGPGVPAEIRDKIFDSFFTTKEVGTGIGLGLSISKDIISQHGGTLYLLAQEPCATFCFELPLPENGRS